MRYLKFLVLVLGMALAHSPVWADSPARAKPYKMVVGEDDQYLFFMIPSHLLKTCAERRKYEEARPIDEEVVAWFRRHCPQEPERRISGLYRNDGSTEPLWSVEWYAHTVHLSSDARYLVRMGPWASSYNQLAVAFYDQGQEIARYSVSDLVKDPDSLPRSVSHFTWRRQVVFDDKSQTLAINTRNGEYHVFDITTGALLQNN